MKFVKNSIEVSQPKSPGYLTRAFEISERNDPNVVRYGASAIDTVQWFHEVNYTTVTSNLMDSETTETHFL